MTTAERRAVRESLIQAGFERMGATQDDGYGSYTEEWWHKGAAANQVKIKWGPKTVEIGERGFR